MPVSGRESGDSLAIRHWGGNSRRRVGPWASAGRLAHSFLLIGLAVKLCLRWAQNAELVTFGIRKDDPGRFTLTNINVLCTVGNESRYLGGLVIWPEVKMESTLARLAVGSSDGIQPRQAIGFLSDHKVLRSRTDHHPSESLCPPLAEGCRIQRVHDHLFPLHNPQPRISVCTALAMEINPPGRGTASGTHLAAPRYSDLEPVSTSKGARRGTVSEPTRPYGFPNYSLGRAVEACAAQPFFGAAVTRRRSPSRIDHAGKAVSRSTHRCAAPRSSSTIFAAAATSASSYFASAAVRSDRMARTIGARPVGQTTAISFLVA